MEAIAGPYYLDPNKEETEVNVSVRDGALWLDAPSLGRVRLYAASNSRLFSTTGYEFDIEKNAEGKPTAIQMVHGPKAVRR